MDNGNSRAPECLGDGTDHPRKRASPLFGEDGSSRIRTLLLRQKENTVFHLIT